MDDRAETMRANERIKAISNMLFNLGTGLIAATAARVYVAATIDVVAVVWSFGTTALIWVAWKVLDLLQVEEY